MDKGRLDDFTRRELEVYGESFPVLSLPFAQAVQASMNISTKPTLYPRLCPQLCRQVAMGKHVAVYSLPILEVANVDNCID